MSWRSRSRSTMPPYEVPSNEEKRAAEEAFWDTVYDNIKEQHNMSDFQYTDALKNTNSSAVKHAYYNTNDKTMVVVMRANGNAYRYDGVPSWVWSAFKSAPSKGTHFATTIKRSYGPSKFLGIGKNLSITEYGVKAPSMGSVTPLRTGSGYVNLGQSPAVGAGRRGPAVVGGRRGPVGTPKALVDNTTSASVEAFPAKTNEHGQVLSKHTVVFDIVGGRNGNTTDVEVTGVQAAVEEIERVAGIMGLEVKVRAVTVYFE